MKYFFYGIFQKKAKKVLKKTIKKFFFQKIIVLLWKILFEGMTINLQSVSPVFHKSLTKVQLFYGF
jgi:hypothetical protein